MKTHIYLIISRSVLLRMRNISGKFAENIKTNILCSTTFSSKIVPFMRYVENYCTAGLATVDNATRAPLHVGYLRLQTHTQNM